MDIGSFKGLYTFYEVAKIYNLKPSCLRKQVTREKFIIGEDIKKFGSTWVITEQAMLNKFGDIHNNKSNTKPKKVSKIKRSRKKTKENSINTKEERVKDSWVEGNIKGVEIKTISFK